MIVVDCTCSASGACLSPDHAALLSAASNDGALLPLIDLPRNGIYDQLNNGLLGFHDVLSRSPLSYVITPVPRYAWLAASGASRKGVDVYFRNDNGWKTDIEYWKEPFEPVEGYKKWPSARVPKEIHMKLQTHMMTPTGFISFHLPDENFQQPGEERETCDDVQHYMALSGGGWRALSSHMGSLRGFSNAGTLKGVKMFSSVSGGSWTLGNLAFDAQFAENVLRNDTPIAEVTSAWMEGGYFPAIRDTMCFKENEQRASSKSAVVSLLSTTILEGPGLVRSMLGSGIVAANFFNFSWQNLVETTVLGEGIADQRLDSIKLAPEARANFGNATLALNWNQLNQWNDANVSACSKWYLRDAAGRCVQYPVYATALYKQRSDDDGIDLEVKMRGQPMDGAFKVCYQSKDDFCLHPRNISVVDNPWSWFESSSDPGSSTQCGDFKLKPLTLGQVVSASSAAAGGAGVLPWVHSLFELVRRYAKDALKGGVNVFYCSHYRILVEKLVGMCNKEIVVDEFLRVLGCPTSDGTKESAGSTAKRWSAALQRMAIRMTLDDPFGSAHEGDMAIDAVRQSNTRTHIS